MRGVATAKLPRPKVHSEQAVLGQRGIALIEDIVLQMRSGWCPGRATETGIDGTIELYDPTTGTALSQHLLVQSKAVAASFDNETATHFDYPFSRRDIEYWRKSNVPVLLIVSRPSTREAYWVSVSRYFSDPARRLSSTVRFDKSLNRFSDQSFRDLLDHAAPADAGVYVGPLAKEERLVSNLLEVASLPSKIYVAAATVSTPKAAWQILGSKRPRPGGCWIIKSRQLIGFHDFGDREWAGVCDQGSVECFSTSEWAESNDPDRRADFLDLLRRALVEKLYPQVRYRREFECFLWSAPSPCKPVKAPYFGLKRESDLTVFSVYTKTAKDGRVFTWYRHMAFEGKFRSIEGKWFLEITPTYVFTSDGVRLDRFHASRLAGIKRLERNRAVVSQVAFWADYIRRQHDLFAVQTNALIFGELAKFDLHHGVDDDLWLKREDEAATPALSLTMGLFDEI